MPGLHIGLDINVSGRELADGSLVEKVVRHLEANDLPADVLTLEVTETEVMADLLQATRVLDELAGLGIRIAIDDYGTGYSSLSYIHRLPVQELKIDRSFVTNLPNDHSNQVIVRSSIAMAHSLGLSVVAEGAEDEVTCAVAGRRWMRPDPGLLPLEAHASGRPRDVAPQWANSRVHAPRERRLRARSPRPLRTLRAAPGTVTDRSHSRSTPFRAPRASAQRADDSLRFELESRLGSNPSIPAGHRLGSTPARSSTALSDVRFRPRRYPSNFFSAVTRSLDRAPRVHWFVPRHRSCRTLRANRFPRPPPTFAQCLVAIRLQLGKTCEFGCEVPRSVTARTPTSMRYRTRRRCNHAAKLGLSPGGREGRVQIRRMTPGSVRGCCDRCIDAAGRRL